MPYQGVYSVRNDVELHLMHGRKDANVMIQHLTIITALLLLQTMHAVKMHIKVEVSSHLPLGHYFLEAHAV